VFAHWSASWPVLIGYVVVAGWHLTGLRRLTAEAGASGTRPDGTASRVELRREAALFHLGLLVVALALVSPLGYWSTVYIWVRAVQSLLVAVIGPGLIVLGAPWLAFSRLARRQAGERAAGDTRPVTPWVSVLPVVVFAVVFVGWQVPALFDLARSDTAVALAEHVTYLAAGVLLWLQLISSRPVSAPGAPLRRLALLTATVGVSTVLGVVLVFGSDVLYPAYANSAHRVMTVLDDQQLSGAVLWMGMLPPLISAGFALVMQWLNNEESADLSAGLDRLLAPRRGGWPSRPVIR
jgi:putative membrane protein